MYQEEEWKRYYESLQEGYKAVGFSYEQPGGVDEEETKQEDVPVAPEDLPFEAPPELQVPTGCQIPSSVKQNTIIEKTAKFTAQHGAQMEIILKIKQGGNAQFKFLSFEDPLNAYYKHMVQMIKSGKFKPKMVGLERQNSNEDNAHHAHGYLHPILSSTATAAPPVSKPIQMPKVCVHTTSYGQLIKSITKSRAETAEKQKRKLELEHQASPSTLDPPPLPPFISDPNYSSSHSGLPPPPGTEPVVLPSQNEYPQLTEDVDNLLENSSESTATPPSIVPPPPDIQPIIDRMAMYVAKNGAEFEMVVKSKKDERFAFLLPHHVHFRYYDFKKCLFLEQMESGRKAKAELEAAAAQKGVSFSIKMKPKEQESVTQLKKPLFDYGSSEDEREGESDGQRDKNEISRSSTPLSEAGHTSDSKSEIPPEVLQKKLAEEKFKDRLAAVAREKLTQANKEKQMQAERKRKAAMFINQLKASGPLLSSDLPASPLTSRSSTPGASSSKDGIDGIVSTSEIEKIDYHHGKSSLGKKSSHSRRGSRSPNHRSRRRSPTPPSAFSNARWSRSRSPPSRRSPPPSEWWPLPNPRLSKRLIRSPPHRKRSRSRERSPSKKRSRSRSPSSKSKKHKKHDRSPKKKKKDKDKDRSRDKEDKGRHRSKEKKDKRKDRHRDSKSKSKQDEEKTESDSINTIVIVSDDAECDDDMKTGSSEQVEQDNSKSPKHYEAHSPVGPRTPDEPSPLPHNVDNTNMNGAHHPLPLSSTGSNANSGQASPAARKVDAPVSQHLLSRVREILKASRDSIKAEEAGLPNS
ncbi:splicing factor, suppressor of white-apricot homolog isoform X2 [Gigantopelta aegis]|nr:splicing factor, suppressor of white-apricot homolog isoform X2 [Gigantopelta aegis]XP_041347939.1 splicing factor, suppressor of white-apricot homolog isoform X2 [Gigantopelta aegis]XP_041347940.1 splicing factor, suppressor of white-apricot homolog isoform X2 [Gigantopelta aegis]